MTDYDLVKLCKEKNNDACLTLFKKYRPFIFKKYHGLQKSFRYKIPMPREEFESEAYISFLKAIDYANLDKITRPEKWLFLGVFMYYMSMQCSAVARDFKKRSSSVPLFIETKEGNEVCIADLAESTHVQGVENDVLDSLTSDSFYKSLDPFEKKVVRKRVETDQKGKPKPLQEVASELGTTFNKVQKVCKDLEVRWQDSRNT